jgi:hypothetical protein
LSVLVALVGCALPLSAQAPFPCATDGTCPGEFTCIAGSCEVAVACDMSLSWACNADRYCGALGDDTGLVCLPDALGVGEPCDLSLDTCGGGSVCTVAGGASPACRPTCSADGECPGGHCVTFDSQLVCASSCEYLGSDCVTGTTCRPAPDVDLMTYEPVCEPFGDGAAGDGCGGQLDCGADLVCVNDNRCHPMCDPEHTCPDVDTCTDLGTPVGGQLGYCDSSAVDTGGDTGSSIDTGRYNDTAGP